MMDPTGNPSGADEPQDVEIPLRPPDRLTGAILGP